MHHMGKMIGKGAGILVLAVLIPAAAFAFGGHWGFGKSQGPPQEAIDACTDLSEGDAVQFTTPRGETVPGTCRQVRGGLIAVPDEGFPGRHKGMGPGNRIDRMAKKLDLSEAQKEQVRAILESEGEKTEPLRKEMAQVREKIRKAALAEPFDEKTVRALAASQTETHIELIVSRARAKAKILALLTPEQRELAEKIGPWGERHHGHRRGR